MSTNNLSEQVFRRILGRLFLISGLLVVPVVVIGCRLCQVQPFFEGSPPALIVALLGVGLILEFPSLINDSSSDTEEQASSMRILCLAVVFTFAAMVLKTSWVSKTLPALDSNWVGLIFVALGGKATQKYLELRGGSPSASIGRPSPPAGGASNTPDSG